MRVLDFHVPRYGLRAKLDFLEEDNPELCAAVLRHLPLESLLGHVVISGEGFWLPTRIVHLAPSRMVKRAVGAVYFNAPGQTICFTYGAITESAPVNRFGQVHAADLPALAEIGRRVWQETVADPVRKPVTAVISMGGAA
jgi:hypothetical protein